MPLYLDGYKNGSQSHSWLADLFFTKGYSIQANVKLTYKEIKEAGFVDWFGKETPKLDYYILRNYA